MAEKIISPGVFTNEIDQSFLPAAIAEVGAMIVGPTVKGPAGIPTKVESYADFVAKFGDAFESGSVELTGTGATVPPDPMDTDVDPLAGDPVNVAIIASGSILGNIIEE